MACCIACCDMSAPTLASIAGLVRLVRSDPGAATNWRFLAKWPFCVFAMAKKLPVFGSFTSGSFFATSAESLVSFTQRPQLAEIPEAACRAAPAVPREGPSRCSPRSLDVSPSAARKRSATVGPFPMTARLSPSLTSAISSSTVGS